MPNYNVTKNFQQFVDGVYMDHYQEVYEFYQAAVGNNEGQCLFSVVPCSSSSDVLLIHLNSNNALRLSPNALAYLPEWIEQNLMDGLDAESYWGLEHAKEKDEIEEREHGYE